MPAMAKEKVLRASRCHLILDRIPCIVCSLARLGKSEGLEGQWVLVDLLIHVDRTGNGSDKGALGNERPVREAEVLQGLALHHN